MWLGTESNRRHEDFQSLQAHLKKIMNFCCSRNFIRNQSNFDLTPKTGKEFIEEIKIGKRILKSFRRILPRARMTWTEGNHEFRLRKYLLKNAKELYGLPGLSVPELFGLKDLKIEYVPCDAMASRYTDNFIHAGNLYVGHWDTGSQRPRLRRQTARRRQRRKRPARPYPAFWCSRANYCKWPSFYGDRKFLDVRKAGKLRCLPQLAARFFGDLLGTKDRTVPVVSGRDSERYVYLEGAKI